MGDGGWGQGWYLHMLNLLLQQACNLGWVVKKVNGQMLDALCTFAKVTEEVVRRRPRAEAVDLAPTLRSCGQSLDHVVPGQARCTSDESCQVLALWGVWKRGQAVKDAVGMYDELLGNRWFRLRLRWCWPLHNHLRRGRCRGVCQWLRALGCVDTNLEPVPLGRGTPSQVSLAHHEDVPGNSLDPPNLCASSCLSRAMELRHVLEAAGDALVVLSIHQGEALGEHSTIQLVLNNGSEALHQHHDAIQGLAVFEVPDQPDHVVLQAGNTANLFLELLPDRVQRPVGICQVVGLDDLEERRQGDGSAADAHVAGQGVLVPALEKADLVDVGFQNVAGGREEGTGAPMGQIAGAVVEKSTRLGWDAAVLATKTLGRGWSYCGVRFWLLSGELR